jgi:AcrR family transcriptional regulator
MRLTKARQATVAAMMKDTICEAAGTLVEQHGVNGLTMERLAKEVGMATGTLYNYFRNKEDLLHFFHMRLVEPYHQAIEKIVMATAPAPKKLKKILHAVLEQAAKYKEIRKLIVEMDYYAKLRKTGGPFLLQMFTAVFEQGIREGAFRRHDPTHTGRMFRGSMRELFDLQISGASEKEINRFAGTMIRTFLAGISLCDENETKPKKFPRPKTSPTK